MLAEVLAEVERPVILVVTGTGTGRRQDGRHRGASRRSRPAGWRCSSPRRPASGRASRATSPRSRGSSPASPTRELARYPEPLAPATAARRAGLPARPPEAAVTAAPELADDHDLVLVEGAGGLLVRFDDDGGTLADVAAELAAPVLVVAAAGLGTLNHTELTVAELRRRGLTCVGRRRRRVARRARSGRRAATSSTSPR